MDTLIPDAAREPRVQVTTAAGFVVVSWWRDRDCRSRTEGSFTYDHYKHLNDALEGYDEYQRGEYDRAREMGIFACDESGMPLHRLDAARLMRLMAEQRSGR